MRMPSAYRLVRGQTSLEYLMLLAVVAVIVIASFGPGSLISKVHDSAQGYYNSVTRVIMGETPQRIDGGWCPVTCPSSGSYGPTIMYAACECPAPAFGGSYCSGTGEVNCGAQGVQACSCPITGQVCGGDPTSTDPSKCGCPAHGSTPGLVCGNGNGPAGSITSPDCTKCICPLTSPISADGTKCVPIVYTRTCDASGNCTCPNLVCDPSKNWAPNADCTKCECNLGAYFNPAVAGCLYCQPTSNGQCTTSTDGLSCSSVTCSNNMYCDTTSGDVGYNSCRCDCNDPTSSTNCNYWKGSSCVQGNCKASPSCRTAPNGSPLPNGCGQDSCGGFCGANGGNCPSGQQCNNSTGNVSGTPGICIPCPNGVCSGGGASTNCGTCNLPANAACASTAGTCSISGLSCTATTAGTYCSSGTCVNGTCVANTCSAADTLSNGSCLVPLTSNTLVNYYSYGGLQGISQSTTLGNGTTLQLPTLAPDPSQAGVVKLNGTPLSTPVNFIATPQQTGVTGISFTGSFNAPSSMSLPSSVSGVNNGVIVESVFYNSSAMFNNFNADNTANPGNEYGFYMASPGDSGTYNGVTGNSIWAYWGTNVNDSGPVGVVQITGVNPNQPYTYQINPVCNGSSCGFQINVTQNGSSVFNQYYDVGTGGGSGIMTSDPGFFSQIMGSNGSGGTGYVTATIQPANISWATAANNLPTDGSLSLNVQSISVGQSTNNGQNNQNPSP